MLSENNNTEKEFSQLGLDDYRISKVQGQLIINNVKNKVSAAICISLIAITHLYVTQLAVRLQSCQLSNLVLQ